MTRLVSPYEIPLWVSLLCIALVLVSSSSQTSSPCVHRRSLLPRYWDEDISHQSCLDDGNNIDHHHPHAKLVKVTSDPWPSPPHRKHPPPHHHPPPPPPPKRPLHPPHDSPDPIPHPNPPNDPNPPPPPPPDPDHPVPAPDLPKPGDNLPDLDHRPHYNRLLHAASRMQFVPSFVFLILLGLHSVLLWGGAAYQQRRRELLNAHPEAGGPRYRSRLTSPGPEYYVPHGTSETVGGGTMGIPPSAEPLDLTDRNQAVRAVAAYVQEARGAQSVVRESRPSTGDMETEPLLSRSGPTVTSLGPRRQSGMGGSSAGEMAGPTLGYTQSGGAHIGAGEAILGGEPEGAIETDPILLLFGEPDTEWGPMSRYMFERRRMIVQPDALTAVKNGGQVAAMLFLVTLALALMGTLTVTSLPQPSAHHDAVGSRMRTLTVILSQWSILGVGIMWALGEATFLALHDLNRARILATTTIFALIIVYGVAVEAENRARLHEVDRIRHPNSVPSVPDITSNLILSMFGLGNGAK